MRSVLRPFDKSSGQAQLPLTFLLKMVLDTNFLKKLSAFSENLLPMTF